MYEETLIDQPYYLGRQWYPDERDAQYPVSAVLSAEDRPWQYWWPTGWWGDQGQYPHCVAFALLHELCDGPNTNPGDPPIDPVDLYCTAQKLDPWDGDCDNHQYDGTSIRAGAKALKNAGLISEYRWASTADDITRAILDKGPVVLGTAWYVNMSWPDEDGFLNPTGSLQGGHAYVANGVNLDRGVVRIKNSWGRAWGDEGYAWMTIETLETLMSDNWAEACLVIPA